MREHASEPAGEPKTPDEPVQAELQLDHDQLDDATGGAAPRTSNILDGASNIRDGSSNT